MTGLEEFEKDATREIVKLFDFISDEASDAAIEIERDGSVDSWLSHAQQTVDDIRCTAEDLAKRLTEIQYELDDLLAEEQATDPG